MVQGKIIEKLKNSINVRTRASECFQNALYGKFLGKTPPLELIQSTLTEKWLVWGSCHIGVMLNGYFFVQCESIEMMKAIMLEGPWMANGMVFQLSFWQDHF